MNLKQLHEYYKSLSKDEIKEQMDKLDRGILAFKLNPNLTFKEAQELLKLPPVIEECIKTGLQLTSQEQKLFNK